MEGLHPDLIKVIRKAAQIATPELDFVVTEGVRTDQQAYINFGKGRTAAQCSLAGCPAHYAQPAKPKVTWLKKPLETNHRVQPDGYGHAFDAYPANPIVTNDVNRCKLVAGLMLTAAGLVGVKLRWGADWNANGRPGESGETDYPHFELNA